MASQYLPHHMRSPICLQYIVLALAASITEAYRHLVTPFYHRARSYAESDEMRVGLITLSGSHTNNRRAEGSTL